MMKCVVAAAYILWLSVRATNATYSIAAVDLNAGEMGAAGCTCVPDPSISLFEKLYYSVQGKGVFLAQGLSSTPDEAHMQLALKILADENNTRPDDILKEITTPDIDGEVIWGFPSYTVRQYGLVNSNGDAASYTGSRLQELYDDMFWLPSSSQEDIQQMNRSSYSFAVQGNVVDQDLVSTVASSFGGCDLADALFSALNSAPSANLGDVRCKGDGVAGTVAFLHVESIQNADTVLHIDIQYKEEGGDGATFDPFVSLRQKYNEWRDQYPCPNEAHKFPSLNQTVRMPNQR